MKQYFFKKRFLGFLIVVQLLLILGYLIVQRESVSGDRFSRIKSIFGSRPSTEHSSPSPIANGSVGTIIAAGHGGTDLSWMEGVREQK